MKELDVILELLSPAQLRKRIERPHAEWRERFTPRVLRAATYDEAMAELGRFVRFVMARWYGGRVAWPEERGLATAQRLLNRRLGDGHYPRSGEFAATRACRDGDRGGMRRVLDELTAAMQDEALKHYLEHVVLTRINQLTAEESMALARAYLARYGSDLGWDHEHPAGIAMRWRQVIHQHARLVLRL